MPAQLQLPYSTIVPASSRRWSAFTTPTCPADVTASAAAGPPALERRARLTAKLAKLAATGQLAPLARQITALGGCAHPIRLTGHRTHLDTATGEILDHFNSGRLPAGELLVRCGNRRATR
ncbi:replication initiator, partial [Streptomyces sp. SID4917]|uniref:replication initiator n=1 Tax=unclassified Streptomyces TaxID=2593676 RepID=UPI00081E0F84